MDLNKLQERLNNWERRYKEWAKPINQALKELGYRVNRDGYTAADYDRDISQIQKQQLAKYNPFEEMNQLLDELCPYYLNAPDQQRQQIRELTSGITGITSTLLGYAYRMVQRIQSPADEQALLHGLAAVSIENCQVDFRDVLLALAELYVTAERAGINPRSPFAQVAKLSSGSASQGGPSSVRSMLANFHTYRVLKERRSRD